jgi:hypothetical protein
MKKQKRNRADSKPFGEATPRVDGVVLPVGATVLQYADAINPDEQWDTCCVCGCAGDCEGSRYDVLTRGLVLLADGTLGRAAWCARITCQDERFSSTYLPRSEVEPS